MKRGLGSTILDLAGQLVAFVVKRVQKEPPAKARDIFHANPSPSEAILNARRAEGMSTVYRSEPPRRGPNAERSDLP